ncbi:phage integrase central domain-containing protein [Tropicimonas omnivorans]|uniref:phage integrase central domain-containing protein n=1 Tax=Tropicimonas omnivorans TaxID=3075590 RepID=UPI003D78A6BC
MTGRRPVDSVGRSEILMCLSPIRIGTHETARRLARRLRAVRDVAKSRGRSVRRAAACHRETSCCHHARSITRTRAGK